MYLKSLELSGFKSFADKTVVEFNRGITSIVGPNGSGKSNILDGILWVLGEQSYKNIRAKESSDVIFSGGKNKKPKSIAEVSLIIENEDRYLDIDFSEVKITRRIYKSGENEYFINNRKARLKDINTLFMDTGIGKQAYSIIGQGRVERIISSNPKELKEIIEEAAGVKRAKTEKEDSIKKLEEVKNEIEKIDYVEKELEKRVSYLKEEGMKARLFKTYTEKIDTQRLMLLEYNINEKRKLQKTFDEEKEIVDESIAQTNKILNEKQENLEKSNEKREAAYRILEEEKNRNFDIFKNIENLKAEYSELNNRFSNLNTEASEKEKRKKVLEIDLKEKKEILEKSEIELNSILKEFNVKEEEKHQIEQKVEALKEKKEKILTDLKEKKENIQNFEVDKIKISHENQDLEKRIFTAQNENKRLLSERESLKKDFEDINKKKETFETDREQKEFQKTEIEKEISEIENALKILQQRYSDIGKEKNSLDYKFENLSSKKRAIENIIENNETFYKGIKYLLNEKIDGIIGAFINLIEIPNGYESAFQTLAGGYFQDIVVKDAVTAQKCIEILKDKKLGRASFLPLDSIKVYKNGNLSHETGTKSKESEFSGNNGKKSDGIKSDGIKSDGIKDGIIGYSKNIVEYDKSLQKVIDFVFGNSIIVENLEIGRKLLKNGFNDRIVTLDGDIITARGRMTGGYTAKGKDELLERKKELKSVESELEKMSEKREELEKKEKETTEKLSKGEIAGKKASEKYEKFLENYRDFIFKYDNFNSEFNKQQKQINTLDYEINENESLINSRKEKISSNISVVENIEKLILQNDEEIKKLNIDLLEVEDLSEYTVKLNTIDKEYEILKVKTDNNRQRYIEIERDYKKLDSEQKDILDFEKRRDELKTSLEKNIDLKKIEITEKNTENEKLTQKIKELEVEIKELEAIEKKLITEVKDVEVKMIGYQNENEKLTDKIARNRKDLEYYNVELEEINEEHVKNNIEYKIIENETEFMAIKRKLSMNEKSRMDIGSVNLSAIDEYERENTRYNELVDQKRDLIESRESLLELIKDIENEIIEKFSHAFEEINKNFEYMCKTILNEAKGMIKLTNPEDLLETGIELSVKYKNKPEQTLMLLSGGEKSMLAVSFIMSIFMFKPSPFTFFDEIEAALDEANTKKIVELLNRFIERSQFILITHNKETMKGSHRLYGVTMNKEIGESRIISVDV